MRFLGRTVTFEQAKLEKRDAWVGLFWTPSKFGPGLVVFVCPLPFVVFRFRVERDDQEASWS